MSAAGPLSTGPLSTGSRAAVAAAGRERARRRRRRGGRLALAGVALVVAAVVFMTIARPTGTVSATAATSSSAPLVLTAPGLLESRSGPVTLRAVGTGPVTVAVGRAGDVTAWAADAARATLTRLRAGGRLAVEQAPGSAAAADPDGSDLWVEQAHGTGSASLTWTPRAGQWLALAAGDGSGPAPHRVVVSWHEHVRPWWSWVLLAAGLVLLAAAAAAVTRPRR